MMGAIIGGIFATVFAATCFWAYRAGKAEDDAAHKNADSEFSLQAENIRHRLSDDAGFAARVRKIFSR